MPVSSWDKGLRLNTADQIAINYVSQVPLALALERLVEARRYQKVELVRPILDLGCGDGIFSRTALGITVDLGVDPDSREIALAKKSGSYISCVTAYGDDIPVDTGVFNTVISNSVIEHIREIGPVLTEIHRVLGPQGKFVFTAPSENFDRYSNINLLLEKFGFAGTAAKFRGFYNRFWKHFHYYELDRWESLLADHGFNVLESSRLNSRKNCQVNDALAPFAILSKVYRRILNRWVLSAKFRRPFAKFLCPYIHKFLEGSEVDMNGGLVFIVAQKN